MFKTQGHVHLPFPQDLREYEYGNKISSLNFVIANI